MFTRHSLHFGRPFVLMAFLAPLFLNVSTASCGKKGGGSSDTPPPPTPQETEAAVKSDVEGVVIAGVDTTTATRLRTSAQSGIAGTEILFPAGSLGVSVDVTVGEGPTFDVASAQSEMGIDSSVVITPTTGTLLITASQAIDPLKPISVTMPLKAGTSLLPAGTKYAVLSQVVRTSTAGSANSTVVMINANAGVTESEGKVTFPIGFFGAHSVVTVPETFSETKEAPSARPLPDPKKPGVDPTPPGVALALESISPADKASVARPSSIELKFNQDIDLASAQASVTLKTGEMDIPVTVTVDGSKVVINPSQSLALGYGYRVLVGSEIKSSTGKALGKSSESTFSVLEGAWGTVETSNGLPNFSISSQVLTRLNHGRFGLSAIFGAGKVMSLQFDGSVWGPVQEITEAGDITSIAADGGIDGRHYVGYIFEPVFPLFGMRYFPALSAPLDIGSSSRPESGHPLLVDTYSKPIVASTGQGKALYLAKRQDHAFVSRLMDGDGLGALETPVAAEANPAYEWKLTVNDKGDAALIFYRQVSTEYRLIVHKRSASGTWTNLTPNGNELSIDVWSAINVGIDNSGKISALWCTSSDCMAASHDGTAWGSSQNLSGVASMPNQRFAFDPKTGTAMVIWRPVENTLRVTTYYLRSATFANGQWSSVLTMDSNSPNAVDPAMLAFDGAARVRAVWKKDGVIKSARFNGGAWSSTQDAYSGVVAGQAAYQCDYSGECMFAWPEAGGVLKFIRYK